MNKKNIIIALLAVCMLFEFGVMIFQHKKIEHREKIIQALEERIQALEERIQALDEVDIKIFKQWKSDMEDYVDLETYPECASAIEELEKGIVYLELIFVEKYGRKPKNH